MIVALKRYQLRGLLSYFALLLGQSEELFGTVFVKSPKRVAT